MIRRCFSLTGMLKNKNKLVDLTDKIFYINMEDVKSETDKINIIKLLREYKIDHSQCFETTNLPQMMKFLNIDKLYE